MRLPDLIYESAFHYARESKCRRCTVRPRLSGGKKLLRSRSEFQPSNLKILSFISILKNILKTTTENRVCLEVGHFYVSEKVNLPLKSSIEFSGFLHREMHYSGINTTPVLFYDDYHTDNGVVETSPDEIARLCFSFGIEIQKYYSENDLAPLAKAIISHLLEKNTCKVINGNILLKNGNVLLETKEGKLSCAVLDASVTLMKLINDGNLIINVLPRYPTNRSLEQDDPFSSYRSQQKKMRIIVREIANETRLPLFSIFTEEAPNFVIKYAISADRYYISKSHKFQSSDF